MYRQSDPSSRVMSCTTARQFQVSSALRRLWMEHVMWTRSFIVSTAFGLADLNDVTKRLLKNPSDFAAALKPFYGSEAASAFEKLLLNHLQIAAALVNAAKAGDTNAVKQQREKWYKNADDIADFLSKANPYWSKAEWQAALGEHLKRTENEAVQLLTGKYAASIAEYDAIQAQALEMADMLAQGITLQFRL